MLYLLIFCPLKIIQGYSKHITIFTMGRYVTGVTSAESLLCGGSRRIKLFKPTNNYSEQNMTHDLTCLAQFLHDYLNPHTEWKSFSEGLRARLE